MAGLGQKQAGRLVRLNKSCPDDIDGIIDTVRNILLSGGVQSLTLKEGAPIAYERLMMPGEEVLPKDSTEGFAELTPFEVIRNVPMEEFRAEEYTENPTPHQVLMWSFVHLHLQDWLVTHLLVSPTTEFWKWLGMPKRQRGLQSPYFFNARIEEDKQIPDNVFILCGARTRHATIAEIGCSIKISIG